MVRVINSDNNLTAKDMKEICDRMWSEDKILVRRGNVYFPISKVDIDEENGYAYLVVGEE